MENDNIVPSSESIVEYQNEEVASSRKKFFVKIGAIVGLIFLGLLVAVAIYNTLSSKTSEANILLATVGDKKIYKSDVRKVALASYAESAVDNKVIKRELNTAVERAILDNQIIAKKITVSPQKDIKAYYDYLRGKVTEGEIVAYVEYDFTWWIPTVKAGYKNKLEYDLQRASQDEMSNEMISHLRNNEDPIQIANSLLIKYPDFSKNLGLNGRLVSNYSKTAKTEPRILNYDPSLTYDPFFKLIYSMKTGEIKSAIWPDGSGGAVIEIVNTTQGEKKDYQEWLNEEIKKDVIYNNVEISKL